MTSHNNPEPKEPKTELPTTDNEPDVEEDATSDVAEVEMKAWLSTKYKPGSKQPMKKPLTAPWGLAISDPDLEKLKVGFKSQSMDDKWDLLVEDPDEAGGTSVHIIRNWLQLDWYILHISPRPTSNDDGGSAKILGITWEGDRNGLQCGAEQAQKEAVMLCRGWLGCEFETLPQYSSEVFWDHSAYVKLGEPEGQAGSNGVSSTAGGADEAREEVDPRLRLHVMSLGSRYWNESQ